MPGLERIGRVIPTLDLRFAHMAKLHSDPLRVQDPAVLRSDVLLSAPVKDHTKWNDVRKPDRSPTGEKTLCLSQVHE